LPLSTLNPCRIGSWAGPKIMIFSIKSSDPHSSTGTSLTYTALHAYSVLTTQDAATFSRPKCLVSGSSRNISSSSLVHSLSPLPVVHTQEASAVPSYPKDPPPVFSRQNKEIIGASVHFAASPSILRSSRHSLITLCSIKTPHCMLLPPSGVLLHNCPALNRAEAYGSHVCCVFLLVQMSEGHTFFTFSSFSFFLLSKFIPDYLTLHPGRLIFIVVTL
jgi:hypothetical protein